MSSQNVSPLNSIQNDLPDRENESLLTVSQAADFLHVSPSHIYKLTHKRRIPYYKPSGKIVYFYRNDLMSFIQKHRVSTAEEIEQNAINRVCA